MEGSNQWVSPRGENVWIDMNMDMTGVIVPKYELIEYNKTLHTHKLIPRRLKKYRDKMKGQEGYNTIHNTTVYST